MGKIKAQGYIMIMFSSIFLILLCVNVLFFYFSILYAILNNGSSEMILLNPIIGVVIPFALFCLLESLLFACNSDGVVEFFKRLIGKANYLILKILTLGLINTVVLYVYSSSYDNNIRLWGMIRCLPIVNVFYYIRLLKSVKSKEDTSDYIIMYLKGDLAFYLFLPSFSQASDV